MQYIESDLVTNTGHTRSRKISGNKQGALCWLNHWEGNTRKLLADEGESMGNIGTIKNQ